MQEKTKKILKRSAFATIAAGALVVVFLTFKQNVKTEDAENYKSPYFDVSDMFRSNTASQNSIDNTTTDENILLNINALFFKVLDPLRRLYGKNFSITSGYRSTKVNELVGGSYSSQHRKGEAADITTGTKDGNKKLFDLIRNNLPFDQLINENNYQWVHVSYKRVGYNRGQVLNS